MLTAKGQKEMTTDTIITRMGFIKAEINTSLRCDDAGNAWISVKFLDGKGAFLTFNMGHPQFADARRIAESWNLRGKFGQATFYEK